MLPSPDPQPAPAAAAPAPLADGPPLDIVESAITAVPTTVAPDQSLASVEPTPGQEIGHRLAADLDHRASPATRPTAARDLIHEMLLAGAEDEITPDLLRQESPPDEAEV